MRMLHLTAAAVLFLGIAAAQTFQLGTANDPCTGGFTWAMPSSPITSLRFSSQPFTCTFAAPGGSGTYMVELDFEEPSAFVPSTDPSGRLFSAVVADAWGSQQFGRVDSLDLFSAGAATATVVIKRQFLALSQDGKFTVTLTTQKRSAVLAQVVITPAPSLDDYVTQSDLSNALNNYVPYTGAVTDVNLGTFNLFAHSFSPTNTAAGSLIFLAPANPVPTSTTDDHGIRWGGVLYLDPADGKVHVLLDTGTVAPAPAQ